MVFGEFLGKLFSDDGIDITIAVIVEHDLTLWLNDVGDEVNESRELLG